MPETFFPCFRQRILEALHNAFERVDFLAYDNVFIDRAWATTVADRYLMQRGECFSKLHGYAFC